MKHCREPGAGPPPQRQEGQKEKDGVEGGGDTGWDSATVAAATSPAWETEGKIIVYHLGETQGHGKGNFEVAHLIN